MTTITQEGQMLTRDKAGSQSDSGGQSCSLDKTKHCPEIAAFVASENGASWKSSHHWDQVFIRRASKGHIQTASHHRSKASEASGCHLMFTTADVSVHWRLLGSGFLVSHCSSSGSGTEAILTLLHEPWGSGFSSVGREPGDLLIFFFLKKSLVLDLACLM